MVIGVSGYGATGASAITGVILECSNIQSFKYGNEFQLLQEPDGIFDLYHYLVEDQRRLSSHIMLKRFLNNIKAFGGFHLRREMASTFESACNDYIESLIQCEWDGKSEFDTSDVTSILYNPRLTFFNKAITKLGKMIDPYFTWPPCQKRYFSVLTKEEFIDKTKCFLNRILVDSAHFDIKGIILLEQLFQPNMPTRGMEFFDDCRSIVVERDPRDLYVLTNRLMPHMCRFMPNSGDVDAFIAYYNGLHLSPSQDERVKYMQYEDIVYDYDNTCRELLSWLGITMERDRSLFVPEQSINNTCLYPSYPEMEADIKRIEAELSEYLYPFDAKGKNLSIKRDINKAFVLKPRDTRIKKK